MTLSYVFFLQMPLFKIMNFSDRFKWCFKLFHSFDKQLFMHIFQKKLHKISVMETQSNKYNGYFFQKIREKTAIFAKIFILDVRRVLNTPLSQVSALTRTFFWEFFEIFEQLISRATVSEFL